MEKSATKGGRSEPGGLRRQVMAIIRARGECTVRDVFDEVSAGREIAYTTVQTVMNRLATRGLLARERRGNIGIYRPVVSTDGIAAGQLVEELVGRFGPLALTQLVTHTRADPTLFAMLRELVAEHEDPDDE